MLFPPSVDTRFYVQYIVGEGWKSDLDQVLNSELCAFLNYLRESVHRNM